MSERTLVKLADRFRGLSRMTIWRIEREPDFPSPIIVRGRKYYDDYLRYADLRSLGLISNRATLRLWMERGAFPASIRLPGPYGTTLLWSAAEVASVLAERFAERGNAPAAGPCARVQRPTAETAVQAAGNQDGLDPHFLPKRLGPCADGSACAQPINERAKAPP
jgi:predicted DNA-binding transcriptional regulator AlpA